MSDGHLRRATSLLGGNVGASRAGGSHLRLRFASEKSIGFWGGVALLVGNMIGPGFVTLPWLISSAGYVPTTLVFLVMGGISAAASLLICEAMTSVPDNEYFQANVEFSNMVLCFFGKRYHGLIHVVYFVALQITNIASIVLCIQVMDTLLIEVFKGTCGVLLYPSVRAFCVHEIMPNQSPFPAGLLVMSLGVLLSVAIIAPLGFMKLTDNIWVQFASLLCLVFILVVWIVTFITSGLSTDNVSATGGNGSVLFSTVMFNMSFILTVPSWANAKKPEVSVHRTIFVSVLATILIYISIGILAAMSFVGQSGGGDILNAILSNTSSTILTRTTAYLFSLSVLMTSIPVQVIIVRYNLLQSRLCGPRLAHMLSGILPWLIAVPLSTGNILWYAVQWTSLIFVSTANFITPFLLFLLAKRYTDKLFDLRDLQEHIRSADALNWQVATGAVDAADVPTVWQDCCDRANDEVDILEARVRARRSASQVFQPGLLPIFQPKLGVSDIPSKSRSSLTGANTSEGQNAIPPILAPIPEGAMEQLRSNKSSLSAGSLQLRSWSPTAEMIPTFPQKVASATSEEISRTPASSTDRLTPAIFISSHSEDTVKLNDIDSRELKSPTPPSQTLEQSVRSESSKQVRTTSLSPSDVPPGTRTTAGDCSVPTRRTRSCSPSIPTETASPHSPVDDSPRSATYDVSCLPSPVIISSRWPVAFRRSSNEVEAGVRSPPIPIHITDAAESRIRSPGGDPRTMSSGLTVTCLHPMTHSSPLVDSNDGRRSVSFHLESPSPPPSLVPQSLGNPSAQQPQMTSPNPPRGMHRVSTVTTLHAFPTASSEKSDYLSLILAWVCLLAMISGISFNFVYSIIYPPSH